MRIIYRAIFVLALLFNVCCAGHQSAKINSHLPTIYFVSPTGSDSSSGTSSAPFKTIQKAANIVNPGDTVIIKDGIYIDTNNDNFVVQLNRGGTASNWITFKAEDKWGAILDGENFSTGYGWKFGKDADYIRVEGLE